MKWPLVIKPKVIVWDEDVSKEAILEAKVAEQKQVIDQLVEAVNELYFELQNVKRCAESTSWQIASQEQPGGH